MEDTTTVVDEGFTMPDMSGMPEWFVNLIDRLMQVLTKLLIKLGIKIAL